MMESWRSAFSVLHQASLNPDSLAGLPLVILTRENINEDEREQQKDLLHLSSRAKHTIAVHSGHFIQIERPDLVIASINEILSTQPAREKTGLAARKRKIPLRNWPGRNQIAQALAERRETDYLNWRNGTPRERLCNGP